MVVTIGLTVGLEVVEVKPAGTDAQLYVLPATAEAPIMVLPPKQIDWDTPALAAGKGFTEISTLLLLLQPVAVMISVTVYVVVTVGLTVGFAKVDVKPAGTEVQL